MDQQPFIEINSVPIEWDLETGSFKFFGLNSALFWINPSLLTMLEPLADEVGIDLFKMMVAYSASQGTDEDYQNMISVLGNTFEEGFLNWGKAVSTAGWGIFEIVQFDQEAKKARIKVSNTWELLLGRGAKESWGCPFIQGKIIGIFSHAFNTECWADEINLSYDTEDPYVEFSIYQSDKTIYEEIKKIRLKRQIKQQNVLALDIEKKTKELEQAYVVQKEANERAESANKAKSQFLATMSHELRTPMSAVLGFTDMLLDDELPKSSLEKVKHIKEASKSLLGLLNDILDMSKIEAGKMEIEKIDFNLSNLINRVIDLFKHSGSTDNTVQLNLNLAANFPSIINSDPTRLRQILVNLIGNALKFTIKGQVSIIGEVIQDSEDNQQIKFTIIDSGIGISEVQLGKLFTAFNQADSSISRKYEGTGLGLVVCKNLCELLNGDIGVESELGKGSEFWFTIPYRECSTVVEEEIVLTNVKFTANKKLHILIAEDNKVNQLIIKNLMNKLLHTVVVVENGLECVEAVKSELFDVIIMDIRMPVMNGLDATRIIRQMKDDKSSMPIIACSADVVKENIVTYFEVGVNAFVSKPIQNSKLYLAINDVMGENIHSTVGS